MLTLITSFSNSLSPIFFTFFPPHQTSMSLIAVHIQPYPVLRQLSSTRLLRQCSEFKHSIHSCLPSCSPHMPKPKVIVISGPTASGKTKLGLHLAKLLDGEVVSADSVQVYKGLDIGSAKTQESERQGVRHHLLDILHPRQEYTAGDFFEDARAATLDILQRGKVPIVVGGTGLYLRWYLYGKPDTPRATPEVVAAVEGEIKEAMSMGDSGWEAALAVLQHAGDLETGQQLARNDWYRLKRALEIVKASGRPRTSFVLPSKVGLAACSESAVSVAPASASPGPPIQLAPEVDGHGPMSRADMIPLGAQQVRAVNEELVAKKCGVVPEAGQASPVCPPEPSGDSDLDLDFDFRCYFLSAPRADLYHRIDRRCEEMVEGGMLQEADWMLREGVEPRSNPASRAIGYRQALAFLTNCKQQQGKSSKQELLQLINECQQASRNYAKRQLVWFRAERLYCWLDASLPSNEMAAQIVEDLDQSYVSWRDRKVHGFAAAKEEAARQASYDDGKMMKHYRTKLEIFNDNEAINKVLHWLEAT